MDFTWLYALAQHKLRFMVRVKDNLHYRRVQSRRVDEATNLRADDTIWLVNKEVPACLPAQIAPHRVLHGINSVTLVLLTDRFDLPALTVAQIWIVICVYLIAFIVHKQ